MWEVVMWMLVVMVVQVIAIATLTMWVLHLQGRIADLERDQE